MRNTIRPIVSTGVACVAIALIDTAALAGVNRWTAIGPDGANVVALAVNPLTPSVAFAGTSVSGILKSTDGGVSWTAVNQGLPTTNVLALAIDPANPYILYAGTDVGVFKSANSGANWASAMAG